MKTAEDIAEEMIGRWRPYMKVFGPSKAFPRNEISMQDDIAQALTAYAEERVKANREANNYFHRMKELEVLYKNARAEALAEVAQMLIKAQNRFETGCTLAAKIRALKDKS
jgi:hypothetical protein